MDLGCLGFTWLTEEAPLHPLSCSLFDSTPPQSQACQFCISGPPLCSCSMAGECEVLGENFIDVEGRVDSEGDCYDICNKTDGCNVFTYLGEGNHLRNYSASSSDIKNVTFRNTCYIFNSCDIFTNDCIGCTSGVLECTICDFGHTMADGSCRGETFNKAYTSKPADH